MARRLRAHVSVQDRFFRIHHFAPGDEPPVWARKLITNPRAWEDVPDPPPAAADTTKPVPTTVDTGATATGQASTPVPPPPPAPPTPDGTETGQGGDTTGAGNETDTGGDGPDVGDGTGDGSGAGDGGGLPERPPGNADRESWAIYATARGIEVTGQMGRDALKAAVEALDAAESAQ